MDILMIYHRLPYPPNKGEKFRAYPQVVQLAASHRVWLACFVDQEEDFQHAHVLEKLCYRFEALPLNKRLALTRGGWNLLRGKTLTEGYYGGQGMWRVIEEWNSGTFFDVAFAFSSSMGAYIENLPVGRRVLDMTDLDSNKWKRYAAKSGWPMSSMFRTEGSRLALRELELIRQCDLTLVVNQRERELVKDPELKSKLAVMPTPMDLERYASVREIHRDQVVGFIGTMDYRPNVEAALWFAEQVWPEIKAKQPQAVWWIVGRNPTKQIKKLTGDPSITVTGAVDDICSYLARMRVFVAPVQEELGIQSKVLEALAAGRPTVISRQGHDGIKGTHGQDYCVANDAAEFARSVIELLNDHPKCEELSKRAVDFVRRHYDTPVVMPRFEELLLGHAGKAEKAVK